MSSKSAWAVVKRLGQGLLLSGFLLMTAPADAGILDASWTAPTRNTDGSPLTDLASYRLYYGTSSSPCPGSSFFQVASPTPSPSGSQTIGFRLSGLTAGTLYNISVSAVDGGGNQGPCSGEASAVARAEFTVSPTATVNFGSVNLQSFADKVFTVTNTGGGTVSGSASVGAPFTIASGSPFTLNGAGATQSVTVRFTPATTTTVSTSVNFTASGSSVSRVVTGIGAGTTDTTVPVVTITSPTSNATFTATGSSLTLQGTASDNLGVTQVSWTSSRGGSGTASGTANWTTGAIVLQTGSNVFTVTARDAAGNTATDTLTVAVNDGTAPTVTITQPTSNSTLTVSGSSVTLQGNASDNAGVTQVTWVNNRGGSGTTTGTTNWSTGAIALQTGSNVLTVTARDAAGNTGTDTLTVTVTDTSSPAVAITSPTSGSAYSTSSATMTLRGNASDNVGVTQVTWSNSRGGSGASTGTTSWTTSAIALQSGTNVLTVTARDAAGNTGSAVVAATLTTTPSDTTAPNVALTAPGVGATVSGLVSVTATASDNVGVVGVQFLLDGAPLGAERTAPPFSLSWTTGGAGNGSHTLSARARDAAGNVATAPGVAVTVSNVVPEPEPAPPSSGTGLVAAYAFNEGFATDHSGNNNTGTLGDGVTQTSQGRFGGALRFNGRSFVTIPPSASLNLTAGMTLEAWVFPTAHVNGVWRNVLIKERSGGEVYNLYSNVDTNRPTVYVVPSGAPGTPLDARAKAQLPLNTWTHLAATYDGTTLRIYVDGGLVGSRAVSGSLMTSTGALRIGGNTVWGEYFEGRIDEVRIYNRALSQVEIQTDMNTPVDGSAAPPTDTTAPVIAQVTLSAITSSTATISWTTSEASDSQVAYGRRFYRNVTPLNNTFVTSHSERLTGLTPNTSYHYQVRSRDAAGNLGVSKDFTFRTGP